jgi:antitoxin ParD1/3/4
MATMTVSLPTPMKDWIEEQIRDGEYASASDYVRDLVRKDRAARQKDFSLEELRNLVSQSRASGFSERSMAEIFAEAERIVIQKGALNE